MSKQVFVGNIPFSFTEDNVKELFAKSGEVTSVHIVRQGTSRSKGYGFVEMGSEGSAQKAVTDLNGKEFEERTLRVEVARADGPTRGGQEKKEPGEEGAPSSARGRGRPAVAGRGGRGRGRGRGRTGVRRERLPAQPRIDLTNGVFIANIPFSFTEEKLSELFAEFKPTRARIVRNPYGHSRGYGFLDLETPELQQAAVGAMSGKEVEGRAITVKIANDEPPNEEDAIADDDAIEA